EGIVAGQYSGNLVDVERGYRFLPRNPESFSYDDDGNLLSDGRWTITWDAENRAKSFVDSSGVAPAMQVQCTYDSVGRRVKKIAGTAERRFVYDGWNLIAILDANNNVL